MQPQYSTDGGTTWYNAPYLPGDSGILQAATVVGSGTPFDLTSSHDLIEATGTDFYGITSSTKPTGVTINLQGVSNVANNPNFEFRLVTAYNPTLPQISDGNSLDPSPHGQYATGVAGPVNAQQNIQFATGMNTGDTFTLTYAGNTQTVVYDTNTTTLDAHLVTALNALVGSATSPSLRQTP